MQEASNDSIRPELGAWEDRKGPRAISYCALGAAIVVLFVAFRDAAWRTTPELHLILETAAAATAVLIGALALVRYYSAKNATLLIVGAGFIGTAALDLYHIAASSEALGELIATDPDSVARWSWFASRLFLSAVFVWAWLEWLSETRRATRSRLRPQRLPERRVYIEVAALTSLTLFLFIRIPLREYPLLDGLIQRPLELMPAVLFAVALSGYLFKGNWRTRPFEVWFVAAMIVGVGGQMLFAATSASPHAAAGTIAVSLKLAGYCLVLTGLLASMFGLYRQVERSACVIRHSNEALQAEFSERRAAEARARNEEARYRTILHTIQEGYYEVDLAGNFTMLNDSLVQLLGYTAEESCRMNYRTYTAQGASSSVFQTFNQVYSTEEPVDTFSWPIVRADGSVRYTEASAAPMRDENGRISGFRGIIRDVSDRMAAERKLEERTRALTRTNDELRQFAHVASHDMQEPLRVVAGYTQLLARRYRGELDEEADRFIDFALDGVTRMQRMIEDLLAYTRVETHGRTFATVNVDEVLSSALDRLANDIADCGATVTRDELPEVVADPVQLRSVFEQLIDNSIKFRDERPLRIHIGASLRVGEWLFSVRDNGIGIEPEYTSQVFQVFRRLHAQERVPGTGIGLAICRRIVDRHGGRTWVESVPGHGTTLFFTVPLHLEPGTVDASVARSSNQAPATPADRPTGEPGAVMAVDRGSAVREPIDTSASTADEAIETPSPD